MEMAAADGTPFCVYEAGVSTRTVRRMKSWRTLGSMKKTAYRFYPNKPQGMFATLSTTGVRSIGGLLAAVEQLEWSGLLKTTIPRPKNS